MASFLRTTFGSTQPDEEEGLLKSACDSLSLTKTQRFYGFGICFGVGFVLSLIGTLVLFLGDLITFAVLYTFGNLLSLGSTGFLVGPVRQCKNMFDPVRVAATAIFLISMVLTLVFAFAVSGAEIICVIFMIIQFIALLWYSASYIPYARALIKKFFTSMCGGD